VVINRTWEAIRENIKISVKGSRLLRRINKGFDEGCFRLLDQRNEPDYSGYMI
jgi:hypothetical protein